MSHPFGDLLSQYLHRKHGLSQSKLAAGILQEPAIITRMCKGERLTGPQARERVLAIIGWLFQQGALERAGEANALLNAAGLVGLREVTGPEAVLLRQLEQQHGFSVTEREVSSAHANLPVMPTPFIGRGKDLAVIQHHLDDARCRMLTLAGPGGVGKTRLAIEAASLRTRIYANGVHFVNMQPVTEMDGLPVAIADALHVALSGSEAPMHQLQHNLANKHMLLLLDNFEHLLVGATTLADLLAAAPQVQVLITSREVLNLREEWQYFVAGVEVPPTRLVHDIDDVDDLLRYDAVRLFVECALRMQPAFSLNRNGVAVVRICQLTEGLPLAIELAAAWTKTLPCNDIVRELEHGLAILTSRLRNTPPRHNSIQAVFDHSWRLLSTQERNAFARLTVFRGGFTRVAAEPVAGATMDILSSLVDKSFLRCTPEGRYQIHELLRQYGEERLAESSDDAEQTLERHGRYYAAFLGDEVQPHVPKHQLEALPKCRADMDNLRAAWRWAILRCDIQTIYKTAAAMYWLYQYGCNYLEGVNALTDAAERLQQEPETVDVAVAMIEVLPYLGWLLLRLGQLEQAETSAIQCLALQRKYDLLPQPGWANGPLTILSIIAAIRGDYLQAERLALEERALVQVNGQHMNLGVACWAFANAVLAQGRVDEAHQAIGEAIELCKAYQQRWFMAYCLTTLGSIEFTRGNLRLASTHYQAAYELREKFDDSEGMAVALSKLGEIALTTGDNGRARQRYEHSLALYHDLNDRGGLSTVLKGLGDVAQAEGLYGQAAQHYQGALRTACDMNYISLIFSLLVAIAGLFTKTNDLAAATSLLILVTNHPSSDHTCREHARILLEEHDMPMPQPKTDMDWQAVLVNECKMTSRQLQAIHQS